MSEYVGPIAQSMLREFEFVRLLNEYLPRILEGKVDPQPDLGR